MTGDIKDWLIIRDARASFIIGLTEVCICIILIASGNDAFIFFGRRWSDIMIKQARLFKRALFASRDSKFVERQYIEIAPVAFQSLFIQTSVTTCAQFQCQNSVAHFRDVGQAQVVENGSSNNAHRTFPFDHCTQHWLYLAPSSHIKHTSATTRRQTNKQRATV